MKRVLLIGLDPAAVDFSDPALPPGMTTEKIQAGVELALADFAARGWHGQNCYINPDETAVPTVERCLASDACPRSEIFNFHKGNPIHQELSGPTVQGFQDYDRFFT